MIPNMGSVYLPLKVNFLDKINQHDDRYAHCGKKKKKIFFGTLIEKYN